MHVLEIKHLNFFYVNVPHTLLPNRARRNTFFSKCWLFW